MPTMKSLIPALLFALFAAGAAAAQSDGVTNADVVQYKRTAEKACVEGGVKKGDPEDNVKAFCGCVMETLNRNMTEAEWRQVVLYSRNNQQREESEAIAPHLKSLNCAAGDAGASSGPNRP